VTLDPSVNGGVILGDVIDYHDGVTTDWVVPDRSSPPTPTRHGSVKPPCPSCEVLLDAFGVN